MTKGDLGQAARQAFRTYLENLLRKLKKRTENRSAIPSIPVDYAQPVVSEGFLKSAGVFRSPLINSQERIYLQKRDSMKFFLDGHIGVRKYRIIIHSSLFSTVGVPLSRHFHISYFQNVAGIKETQIALKRSEISTTPFKKVPG